VYVIICPNCKGHLGADEDYTGVKVECYLCSHKFTVEQVFVQEADTPAETDASAEPEAPDVPAESGAAEEIPAVKSPVGQARRSRSATSGKRQNKAPAASIPSRKNKVQKSRLPVIAAVFAVFVIIAGSTFFYIRKNAEFVSAGAGAHSADTAVRETPLAPAEINPDTELFPADLIVNYSVSTDPDQIIRKHSRKRLLGTNIAAWHNRYFKCDSPENLFDLWEPGMVRMPGGSWSDSLYWNGNKSDVFNKKTGMWQIDYSGFAPGFKIDGNGINSDRKKDRTVDVRIMHDFVNKIRRYAEPMVTVNLGTGDAEMAAEWVRWANKKQNYHIQYWQVGNEICGGWEAGHYLWGGGIFDADLYIEKFAKYSTAMKKVDPTVKVGAQIEQNWVGPLLKALPESVDFVDHHYYFGDRKNILGDVSGAIGDVRRMIDDVEKDHKDIKMYSPNRKVEIGVTEWNLKTQGLPTADMDSALLSSYTVGKMMEIGVDFATQWDAFTINRNDSQGHGLAIFKDDKCIPKSQVWAFRQWSRNMSDTLVKTEVSGGNRLYSYSTLLLNKKLSVMLINIDRKKNAIAEIVTGSFEAGKISMRTLLSQGSYLYNPHEKRILWSEEPTVTYAPFRSGASVIVPPYSVMVLEIPVASSSLEQKFTAAFRSEKKREIAEIELIVPDKIPPVQLLRGFVVVKDAAGNIISPFTADRACSISVSGSAELVDKNIVINSGVGCFEMKPLPGEHGEVSVKAEYSSFSVSKTFTIRGAIHNEFPVLNFERPDQIKRVKNGELNGKLSLDSTVRPNANVLSIALDNPSMKGHSPRLCALSLKHLKIPHKTAGISFDAALSQNCSVDSVTLMVGMNGHRFGTCKVTKQKAGLLKNYSLIINDVSVIDKMVKINQCQFNIGKIKGLKGEIYIDDITLIGYE